MRDRSFLLCFVAAALVSACDANTSSGPGGNGGGNGGSGGTGASAGNGGTGNITFGGFGGTGGGSGTCTAVGPDDDFDQDGFTIAQGDCNDCDPNVNPGAIEVIATPDAMGNTPPAADEDCNGVVDDVAPPCDDAGFPVADFDPMHG